MVYQKKNQIVEKFDQQLGLRKIRHGLDKSPTFSDPPKWTASLKQEGAKITLFDTLMQKQNGFVSACDVFDSE